MEGVATVEQFQSMRADQGIAVSARYALKNLNNRLEEWTEQWITEFIAIQGHSQMLKAKGTLRVMLELHDALSGLVEESEGEEEDNAVTFLAFQMKWNALRSIISSSGEKEVLVESQSYLAALREIPKWIS